MQARNVVKVQTGIFYIRYEGRTDIRDGLQEFSEFVASQSGPIKVVVDLTMQDGYSTDIRKAWVDIMMTHQKSVEIFYLLGAKALQRLAVSAIAVFIQIEHIDSLDDVPGWSTSKD